MSLFGIDQELGTRIKKHSNIKTCYLEAMHKLATKNKKKKLPSMNTPREMGVSNAGTASRKEEGTIPEEATQEAAVQRNPLFSSLFGPYKFPFHQT